jgi:tetratricopeptide (TPR) repeat protein
MGGNYNILALFLAVCFFCLLVPPPAHAAESAVELYRQGMSAQEDENYYLAVEKYKAALDVNPYYLEAMKGLAQCFFFLNEYQESLRYITMGRKYNKNDAELLALEGRVWIVLGDLNKAQAQFSRVLALEPNNIEAMAGIALLDIAAGRTSFAVKQFEQALRISPSYRQALLALVIINQQLMNYPAAERYLELALRHHSNDALVHFIAGKYYFKRGSYEQAERHLATALALNNHNEQARELLGRIYFSTRNYDRAVQVLGALPQSSALYYLARYTMAKSYAGKGDIDNAIINYKRALGTRPDDEASRIALENLIIDSSLPETDPRRAEQADARVKQGNLFRSRYMLNMALLQYRIAVMLDKVSSVSKQAMFDMADIYRLRGFPMKYLEKLKVIRDTMGPAGPGPGNLDKTIANDIGRYEYQKKNLVSSKWGLEDQYKETSTPLSMDVFNLTPGSNVLHPGAGGEFTKFFTYILFLYEKKIQVENSGDISSFEEGFRKARNAYTDFFLILSFKEAERSINVECGLYLSRTGALLHKFNLGETGNDRVQSVLLSLGDKLNAMLPLRGRILARRFDQALIDLGSMHGLKKDDKLLILKKGSVSLHNGRVGFSYNDSDIVGEFTVTGPDEAVSEGTIKTKGYYDLVNIGDEVIFEPEVKEGTEKNQAQQAGGLLQDLMELR